MNRSLYLAGFAAAMLAGCSPNLAVDGVLVACSSDADCDAPQRCNEFTNLCASPDDLGPPPTPGVVLSSADLLETTEAGATATFGVALTAEPTAAVSIALRSSDPLEGFISPSTLTFGPLDWSRSQLVTVTGADDFVADGDKEFSVLLLPALSDDPAYQGLDGPDVSVTNRDDDVPSILVTPMELTVNESGTTGTFTVVAGSRPASIVNVPVQSANLAEATVMPAMVAIDPASWSTPVEVTVQGVEDAPPTPDGPQMVQVLLGPAQSSDPAYEGLVVSSVTITNQDNDQPGFTVNPLSGLVTNEVGGQASFTVVLNTQPSASVTVAVSSGNTQEATVDTTQLMFDDTNWDQEQTVTATGVADGVPTADGPQVLEVVLAPAVSGDASYDGLDPPNPTVVNADTDVAALLVSGVSMLTEGGAPMDLTVRLSTRPAANVMVTLSPLPALELSVAMPTLTFTRDDWDTNQNVALTPINNDTDLDGEAAAQVDVTASSTDPFYDMLEEQVQIVIADDDQVVIPLAIGVGPFGSVAAIDALCDSAATMGSLPDGTYKAMVTGDDRRASTNPNEGDGQMDWVFHPGVTYYNANLNLVGTATATGLLSFPLDAPLNPGGLGNHVTGMLGDWTTPGSPCGNWSITGSSVSSGAVGATDFGVLAGGGSISCADSMVVLCVGQ